MDHRAEVLEVAGASRHEHDGLNDAVERLGRSIGQPAPQVRHHSIPVLFNGFGRMDHLRIPRVAHPIVAAFEPGHRRLPSQPVTGSL